MFKLSTLAVLIIPLTANSWAAERQPVPVFEKAGSLRPRSRVDRAVFSRVRREGFDLANLCSDAVFVRRAYLDTIGTLPTANEAYRFLAGSNPNKRRVLIDKLLEHDAFAAYWAMKWCDLLRVKAEFPVNLWPNGVQAYYRWLVTSLRENKPYDEFVRELLTSSGSNFRDPRVNFYRSTQSTDPKELARSVALTFMGVRVKHWPAKKLEEMAKFFSYVGYKSTAEWKEEIVYFDAQKLRERGPHPATLPDGTTVQLTADQDPRIVFADWLIDDKNPYFARNIANRAWFWLLGRGVIHEPDDIRDDNPPSNPVLLTALEKETVRSDYDLKELFRTILNSKTYQLSCIPQSDEPEAAALFAHYHLRPLDAEVLLDAICRITGTTEEYSSRIPEPFTWVPERRRSIALADGSITSPFLEMFGRPPRDTGMELERNPKPSASQRLHMLNSSHIHDKIRKSDKLRELFKSSDDRQETVAKIYLTVLSRLPVEQELQVLNQYAETEEGQGRAALVDLTWSLFNSMEFLYRH